MRPEARRRERPVAKTDFSWVQTGGEPVYPFPAPDRRARPDAGAPGGGHDLGSLASPESVRRPVLRGPALGSGPAVPGGLRGPLLRARQRDDARASPRPPRAGSTGSSWRGRSPPPSRPSSARSSRRRSTSSWPTTSSAPTRAPCPRSPAASCWSPRSGWSSRLRAAAPTRARSSCPRSRASCGPWTASTACSPSTSSPKSTACGTSRCRRSSSTASRPTRSSSSS